MKILRTANAGVLLTLDGVRILLDGVCGDLPPYLTTPDDIKLELCKNIPDVVAYTHFHTDHTSDIIDVMNNFRINNMVIHARVMRLPVLLFLLRALVIIIHMIAIKSSMNMMNCAIPEMCIHL